MKFKTRLLLIPLLLVISLSNNVFAQEDPLDKVSWKFTIEQNECEATIIGTATIVEHWHVYAANLPEESFTLPTELVVNDSPNYKKTGGIIEPNPEIIHDKILEEDLYLHSNTVQFKQKIIITASKNFTLKGRYSFQTCDETHCLPPYDGTFELKVKGCSKVETIEEKIPNKNTSEEITTPSSENQKDTLKKNITEAVNEYNQENEYNTTATNQKTKKETDNKSLITIFFLTFLSGFAALLTPCVFPMIPMTVSFFTKQSKSKSQGIKNAIIFGLSIIAIYVLLGTVVTKVFGSDSLYAMSTNMYFNLFFFVLLVVFAVSFLGAFEITLPNSWLNKADSASDRGGLIGIFFMALTLALVSFSCTGPIVGTLLVEAANVGGIGPIVGMLGFSLALALPFTLFATFPGWMNSLPKSGGWLNTVKVVLGFLELALAFKFLSNADLVMQTHYLEREVFLAIWIGVFGLLAIYLFGFIQLPHDSPLSHISVGRALLGLTTLIFVIYMIPGLWGAPLKIISAFPPPMEYSESPRGFGSQKSISTTPIKHIEGTKYGPQGLPVFHDLDTGLAYAKKIGKPAFLDFTGRTCVNCRRMEQSVWGEPGVIELLQNDVVIISLEEDDPSKLPENERNVFDANGNPKTIKTLGDKWKHIQAIKYHTNTQPYYVMYDNNGNDLDNGSADYEHHSNPKDFQKWLEEGIKLYKSKK